MSRVEAEESEHDERMHVKDARPLARGLANAPVVERVWTPDRNAMRAALRVALGLPKQSPFGQEVSA